MATTAKNNVVYKVFNGTDWEIVYFTTTAGSVLESEERKFLNPTTHTVNGYSFFDEEGTAQAIKIALSSFKNIEDRIVYSFWDREEFLEKYTKETYTLADHLMEFGIWNGTVDDFMANIGDTVVSGIISPLNEEAVSGVVDLTPDFALYLPLAGGTMTGTLSFELKEDEDGTMSPQYDIYGVNNVAGITARFTTGTFSGNVSVGKNLTVSGDLVVNGSTTTIESVILQVEDNLITLAKDNKVALTNPAGIVVPKYDGTNNGALFFDKNGIAWVGDVGLNAYQQIDMNHSGTTALPLAVVDKTIISPTNFTQFDGEIVKLVQDDKANTLKLINTGYMFGTMSTYDNVASARSKLVLPFSEFANYYGTSLSTSQNRDDGTKTDINLLAKDGETILGTVTLGSIINQGFSDLVISLPSDKDKTANKSVAPSKKAVATAILNYSSKIYYNELPQDSETSNFRAGDVWIDLSNAGEVSVA